MRPCSWIISKGYGSVHTRGTPGGMHSTTSVSFCGPALKRSSPQGRKAEAPSNEKLARTLPWVNHTPERSRDCSAASFAFADWAAPAALVGEIEKRLKEKKIAAIQKARRFIEVTSISCNQTNDPQGRASQTL